MHHTELQSALVISQVLFTLICASTLIEADTKSELSCPVEDDQVLKSFDIALPEDLQVPPRHTTYVCQQFKIPEELMNQVNHIVAFKPQINNREVMHHMIVFGCRDETPTSKPHACGAQESTCRSFLTVWSLGFKDDICLYRKTGITIGRGAGYKTLSLQIHWNNEHLSPNRTDSSGVRIYYTSGKPQYELGNVQIGQEALALPPQSPKLIREGSCSPYCTDKYLTRPVYLSRTFLHMHSLGTSARLDHYRDGELKQTVAYDQIYSYHHPPVHDHEHAIKILPGDEVRMSCTFNTADGENERNRTIYWGEGVDGEMCYAFVSYFPRTTGFDQCVQYDHYDQCDNYNEQSMLMGKCDFRRFQSSMNGEIAYALQTCDDSHIKQCSRKCASSVKRIYSHPCAQGTLYTFLTHRVATTIDWDQLSLIHSRLTSLCPQIM